MWAGLGLGACTIGTRQVSDGMVLTSAETLASLVTPEEMALGMVYPSLDRIRDISARIAAAVAQCAIDEVGTRRWGVHVFADCHGATQTCYNSIRGLRRCRRTLKAPWRI